MSEPHTVRSRVVSINPDVTSSDYTHIHPHPAGPILDRKLFECAYNAHTKHLHPDARIHCVRGTAGALRVQPLQGCTDTHVKVIIKMKERDAVPSYCEGSD